jgi:hypothetical protein
MLLRMQQMGADLTATLLVEEVLLVVIMNPALLEQQTLLLEAVLVGVGVVM